MGLATEPEIIERSPARLPDVQRGEPGALVAGDPTALVRRAQSGCLESFSRLVELFSGRLFSYLLQMTRQREDAEDLTQVTFIKAYRKLDTCVQPEGFGAWLFTIARRTAWNHFRDTRPTEELDPNAHWTVANPADTTADQDDGRSIWEVARQLKAPLFEALWLYYAEGLSVAETAGVMRRNPITVRVLLHRGRNALGRKLSRQYTRAATGRPVLP